MDLADDRVPSATAHLHGLQPEHTVPPPPPTAPRTSHARPELHLADSLFMPRWALNYNYGRPAHAAAPGAPSEDPKHALVRALKIDISRMSMQLERLEALLSA